MKEMINHDMGVHEESGKSDSSACIDISKTKASTGSSGCAKEQISKIVSSGASGKKRKNGKSLIGWIGVVISIAFSSLWAYWGIMENFHEGWYAESVWENLFMLFFQYLLVTFIFVLLAVCSLRWRRIGLGLHLLLAAFCVWFFSGGSFQVVGLLIVIPIIGLGVLCFFGEPKPKRAAYWSLWAIPLAIVLVASVPQMFKVANRLNDGNFGVRTVKGAGVTLSWAPCGPGWPDKGMNWEKAREVCRYLSEVGSMLMDTEQNIWRLPTVEEAVRSMMRHGSNAGGIWDPEAGKATYARTPDKETPLWDVHSQVIYYWTSETDPQDTQRAYIIVYHGGVFTRRKTDGQAYLSFRAVK